jgi:hypothetical protein
MPYTRGGVVQGNNNNATEQELRELLAKATREYAQLEGLARLREDDHDRSCQKWLAERAALLEALRKVRELPAAFRKMEMYADGNKQAMTGVNICADLLDGVLAVLDSVTKGGG